MQLSPHFTLEALCSVGPHGGIKNVPTVEIDENLLKVAEKLEETQEILGVDLRPSYGYRCPALNQTVGGSTTSAHLLGLAVDFVPQGVELRPAWERLAEHPTYMQDVDQLIIERGCIHIGLALPAHDNVPRRELRLDGNAPDGHRVYPLYGHWTPKGVIRG